MRGTKHVMLFHFLTKSSILKENDMSKVTEITVKKIDSGKVKTLIRVSLICCQKHCFHSDVQFDVTTIEQA